MMRDTKTNMEEKFAFPMPFTTVYDWFLDDT